MAIGRPIELTPNITSKNISIAATEGQTEFTVTGGYRINELAVYRNGVRLVDGRDFSATDGNTVTFISDTVVADDIVEFSVFDSFDVAGVIVSASSTQAVNGNLHVTGELYAGDFLPSQLNVTGVGTIGIGSFTDINVAGGATVNGTLVAGSFSGDGSALTGIANTAYIVSVATTTADLNVTSEVKIGTAVTIGSAGIVSAAGCSVEGALTGSTLSVASATFTGAVNIDATTDSTSTSTGALIVDGGVGIAKNVYIGAGLSVAGTLTYEDVTSVDSVGLITAKSGVNITGGQLTVGSGITMGIAGVATFSGTGDVHLLDNVQLNVGDASDLVIKHDGSHSRIQDTGTGYLILNTNTGVLIKNGADDENIAIFSPDGACELNYNATKKFETTNDGTVTTGIATATAAHITGGGEFKVGTALTVASTSGVATFSRAVTFKDADVTFDGDNQTIKFVHDANCIRWADSAQAQWGDGQDLRQYHDGSHGNINVMTGDLIFKYNSQETFRVSDTGTNVTGIGTFTEGLSTDGLLREKFETTAGKLSDNTNIDLADGMVHYFSTQETTTCTPNIRYNSSTALNNMMHTGESITVTIITTAAAAGYFTNMTIDGSAQTEEWIGGSAPSAGGSDGLDIYSFTILKTASATWKVIVNVSNASN